MDIPLFSSLCGDPSWACHTWKNLTHAQIGGSGALSAASALGVSFFLPAPHQMPRGFAPGAGGKYYPPALL